MKYLLILLLLLISCDNNTLSPNKHVEEITEPTIVMNKTEEITIVGEFTKNMQVTPSYYAVSTPGIIPGIISILVRYSYIESWNIKYNGVDINFKKEEIRLNVYEGMYYIITYTAYGNTVN